jgi:hypothetical protein
MVLPKARARSTPYTRIRARIRPEGRSARMELSRSPLHISGLSHSRRLYVRRCVGRLRGAAVSAPVRSDNRLSQVRACAAPGQRRWGRDLGKARHRSIPPLRTREATPASSARAQQPTFATHSIISSTRSRNGSVSSTRAQTFDGFPQRCIAGRYLMKPPRTTAVAPVGAPVSQLRMS